ncbi:MAG: putative MATE family efflux protein [Salibacteraceae bacterium]|jgi:putative MATE family efflux protein
MLDLRYKTILSVAIPLMASSFIQSIVMITDSAFLSRYSTVAYNASGNGGLIYVTMFVALMGMADGAQILMARRIGEKKENLLAQIFGTTIFTNIIIALILCAFIQFFIPNIIDAITRDKAIASGETTFVQIRSYGLFFSAIALSINAYLLAMGKTYVVLLSAIVIAFSNIGLDYALIFGHWGLPEMGLEGAAYASMIADGMGMLFLILALNYSNDRKRHQLFTKLRYNYNSFKTLLKVGAPILFQGLVALITWTAFFVWIEQKGFYELTISQNIRTLYFLAFIPIWGFAGTTKTYISQYIGGESFKEIKIVQRRIQFLTFIFLVALFHGAVLYPETLVRLINPEAEYIKGSAEVLRFISGSVLIYGLSSVYFQTINGSGNTRFTFYIETIAVGFYLGFAYLFIKVFNWDIYWVWSVEYIYFGIMGILSIGYLRFFNWQKKTI